MRILLLTHSFNSLSQRIFAELEGMGHDISVEFDINDETTAEAAALFNPHVIVAPFLKRAIAKDVWQNYICLIIHPGPLGDRGPSALDWAILKDAENWGVTILQANGEMDAGRVWATENFKMRPGPKSGLYRNEVTEAAVIALCRAIGLLESGKNPPALKYDHMTGWQPMMRQADRRIDWQQDSTKDVLKKIRSADGMPGVRDCISGRDIFLYDARPAPGYSGRAGDILARSGPALCRATRDGAVWIGHMRDPNSPHPFKLPATMVLADDMTDLQEVPMDVSNGYDEINYLEKDGIGFLAFDFYNGAMSQDQCRRLLAAYRTALRRDTRVIILQGGTEFWSNGMHLNIIEAADNPAEESWNNINAMDDLAEAIIRTGSHITIAAMGGNAGAGGVFLARACDQLWLRDGVILSPHYRDMGNLYGSEFWTYSLPRQVGVEKAAEIAQTRLPMVANAAVQTGLADMCFSGKPDDFNRQILAQAKRLCQPENFTPLLSEKNTRRARDEQDRPLSDYRTAELEKMKQNFYGFDSSYHVARYNFVHKIAKSRTPLTLARHRSRRYHSSLKEAS